MSAARVTPVACLEDNYAYLLQCTRTGIVAVVDPSEPGPVVAALENLRAVPAMVLCTHHHGDHIGGVPGLLDRYGDSVEVVGHASERARIPLLSRAVNDGDVFTLGEVRLRVMHVPGHTLGAVAFVVEDGEAVFTGDTMFIAGCGRLFEGTAAMMLAAMDRFAALPDGTAVYPGHEYAEKNLRFATTVDPTNDAARARLALVREKRARGEACVPGTVREERAINPFMRAREEGLRAFARGQGAGDDAVSVLAAVRAARNAF